MIVIAQSLWNQGITDRLVEGAAKVLHAAKLSFEVIQVPGALELAYGIDLAVRSKKVSAAIACGAVIKGDTYHFEIVSNESARALTDLSLRHGIPLGNAVLTTYTLDQAYARAGGPLGNKGAEGAEVVIQLLELQKRWTT